MNRTWTPRSWRDRPLRHVPTDYPDARELARVEQELSRLPALVSVEEILRLRQALGQVAEGRALLLQGGDCAESFKEFSSGNVHATLEVLLRMAVTLTFASGRPVVRVGRIAGQFAKPRSSPMETQGDVTLPSYRGDNINGMEFTAAARTPDPERLLRAWRQSAATMELVRAFPRERNPDLEALRRWVTTHPQRHTGQDPREVYTSHEALLLNVEEAQARLEATTGDWYAASAHLLWIGERTRQLDGGHVEFLRGVKNPLGLKCGPTLEPEELLRLMDVLNPEGIPGRLTLIGRFGADTIGERLPRLMAATRRDGRPVVWATDPMHGNTVQAANGYKTRPFERILAELRGFIQVAAAEGVHPGGYHLELTGQDVTECLGGARALTEGDLPRRYFTHCDPRLNSDQAEQLAFLVSEHLSALPVPGAQAA